MNEFEVMIKFSNRSISHFVYYPKVTIKNRAKEQIPQK